MRSLRDDFGYGLRLIQRSPGFAVITILTLALGIGANTAVFSILNALVLRKLPVHEPDRLVEIAAIYRNGSNFPFSFSLFQQIEQNQRVFSDVFGWSGDASHNVQIGSSIFVGSVRAVSGNYYSALGAAPLIGRLIALDDAAHIPGAPVVVLGYEFWQQRFGGDPNVVGTAVRIDGEPFTIIGVSRKWFTGMTPGAAADITVPLTAGPYAVLATKRSVGWISVAARLRPGVSAEQAHSQLQSFWRDALVATVPTSAPGSRLQSWLAMGVEVHSAATGMNPYLRSHFERPLQILMGIVVIILLAACVNLANLSLARSEARSREITLRLSLGAVPGRIVRQLFTEILLLSSLGALLALLAAFWTSRLLVATITGGMPLTLDLRPDWRVFFFATSAAVATALLIGLAPAWRASRRQPADVLRANASTATAEVGLLPRALIVVQIGLSAVLLVGAGLLLRSFEKLRTLDPEFERNQVVQFALQQRPGGFQNVDLTNYRKQVIDDVATLPGVLSASFAGTEIPLGSGWRDTVSPLATDSSADSARLAVLVAVSPKFFHTLGIPLVSGRDFDWSDDPHHPPVAIVASNLARRLRPGGDAVGMRIRFGVQPEFQQLEIVGIAHSARLVNLRTSDALVLYVPVSQHPADDDYGSLFVRSRHPDAITREVETKIQSLGHEYSRSTKTLRETSQEELVEDRTIAVLSSIFGGLALLLAGIGLFGLMSYGVTRRTREIGIRMALGSRAGAVLRLVLRESLVLSTLGVILGIPCALAATHLFSHFLFGVKPTDPATLLFTFAALLLVSIVAGYLPARRAATTDPMVALRHE